MNNLHKTESGEHASFKETPILKLEDICQSYLVGSEELVILNGINLTLNKGEITGIIGPSGCGKSSLLHIIGLLESPKSGNVIIDGGSCRSLSDRKKTRIRSLKIGFIYQFHHLLPEFNALENVILPQLVAGCSQKQAYSRSEHLLTELGLKERLKHRPAQLSGGERQRVAIARALSNQPGLLLADEPTGNLDPKTSDMVLNSLLTLARNEGVTILMATHNYHHIQHMNRVSRLDSGKLKAVGQETEGLFDL